MSIAREFLASQPVLHNVILSLLHDRIAYREPGRYWAGARGDKIVAVVFQSPLTFAANLTPMEPNVAAAMVDAIADAGVALPGVKGEAATAANFAGQWTERCKLAAIPFQGERIYEFLDRGDRTGLRGRLRKAISDDRSLMVSWIRAFHAEIGEYLTDPELLVDRWLPAGQLWLWDNGQTTSMAVDLSLTNDTIRRHLEGEPTLTFYAINPGTTFTCALDRDWRFEANFPFAHPTQPGATWVLRSTRLGRTGTCCVKQGNQVVPGIGGRGLRVGLHVMPLILPFCYSARRVYEFWASSKMEMLGVPSDRLRPSP